MLKRYEGQQIQNKVAKVKVPVGVGVTVESNDKKEKTQELRDWTSDCVYETVGSSLFFFPLEIGLLEMFMMAQFKLIWVDFIGKKFNTQKLANATVW